jgi:hypothetical protein
MTDFLEYKTKHDGCARDITQWSRKLLKKLIVAQLVKKYLASYENTVFTIARYWSLS